MNFRHAGALSAGGGAMLLLGLSQAPIFWRQTPLPSARVEVPTPSPRATKPDKAAVSPSHRSNLLDGPPLATTSPAVGFPPMEAAPQSLTGSPEELRQLLLWAEADPGAAMAWADERPDATARRDALQAVCFKIAEKDPRGAVAMAEAFGFDDGPGVMENLIAQWAASDPEAAQAWAVNRPPGPAREGAMARIAFAVSSSDPAAAVRLIKLNLTDPEAQADALASVVALWAAQDHLAASSWANALPADPLRDRLWRELAPPESGSVDFVDTQNAPDTSEPAPHADVQ
ncbi:MAG: hypothetical protein H7X95_03760 [Deltaproteobacteria bacterium]|nr:hypothetical protein [Deltaproteobacteria bacterium]